MINLLPPSGLPQPHEANDARSRREPGRDFAEWLLQTPKQPGVAPAKDEASPTATPASVTPSTIELSPVTPVVAEAAPVSQTVSPELTPICFAPAALTADEESVQTPAEPAPVETPVETPAIEAQPPVPADRANAQPWQTAEQPHLFEPRLHLPEVGNAIHVLPTHPEAAGHVRPALADDVLLPWRLQANAGLSYVGEPAWQVGARGDAAAAHAPGFGNDAATTATSTPEFGGPIAGNLRRGATPWTSYLADFSFGGVDREKRMERLSQYLAAHPDWKERLLRWVGSDADLTAWIRDFQLGEDDLGALVQKLREYAQEHGHALARVMHNGREVWSAANHSNNGSES
jgi:hypothetical protein